MNNEKTFVYDDSVIVRTETEHSTRRKSLSVDVINRNDEHEFVSIWVHKHIEYSDGSTGFDNESTYAHFTREQALAFAHAIIKQCAR